MLFLLINVLQRLTNGVGILSVSAAAQFQIRTFNKRCYVSEGTPSSLYSFA